MVFKGKRGYGIDPISSFRTPPKKEEDPKGDRVVVTYSGKFLPYRKW